MTLRQFLHHLVQDTDMGFARVQETLNFGRTAKMSEQVLRNKLNYRSESHTTNTEEFEKSIDALDGNFATAEYFAAKCNSVVFQLPDGSPMGDMSLLDALLKCQSTQGDFSKEFLTAYSDGVIDQAEFKRIDHNIVMTIAKLLELKASTKQVVR